MSRRPAGDRVGASPFRTNKEGEDGSARQTRGVTTLRSLALAALLLVPGLAAPGSASASPDILRRSIENIVTAPLDVVLAPVNGWIALRANLPHVSDSPTQRRVYAVPGYLGLTLMHVGTGVLRAVSGVAQLPPGIALFAFDTELPPRFDPFRQGSALVDWQNPLAESPPWLKYVPLATPFTIDTKFGILSPWAVYTEESTGGS
jgi:hypothetical protein